MLDRYEEGVEELEKAIALQPKKIEWKLYLTQYYVEHQQFTKALHHLQESLKCEPDNPEVYISFGNISFCL